MEKLLTHIKDDKCERCLAVYRQLSKEIHIKELRNIFHAGTSVESLSTSGGSTSSVTCRLNCSKCAEGRDLDSTFMPNAVCQANIVIAGRLKICTSI